MELVGRWSSKGSWFEVVIKGSWLGRRHQKGADVEVVIKRELMGRWSSKKELVGR